MFISSSFSDRKILSLSLSLSLTGVEGAHTLRSIKHARTLSIPPRNTKAGNTKGGSITVQLTPCLTCLD